MSFGARTPMPSTGIAAVHRRQAGNETRLRTGAARGMNQAIDAQSPVVGLGHEFQGSVDVSESTDGVRPAAGDDVGPATLAAQLAGKLLHRAVHVGTARHARDLGPEQAVEEDVAIVLVLAVPAARAILEDHVARQPEFRGDGHGLAHVIGLRRTLRDDRVGALPDRVRDQELELARLVAAAGEPCAVVTLDPQSRATEIGGQVVHGLEGCRQVGEGQAGKAG
jgi:hypothetical protein